MYEYSTNLTDNQWQVIEKIINAQERVRKHSLRNIMNAILYINKTGCQWRLLPREFGPWQTVYYYLYKQSYLLHLTNVLPSFRCFPNDGSLSARSPGWRTSDARPSAMNILLTRPRLWSSWPSPSFSNRNQLG
ncbi:MAG: transposase [Bacteroidales bacterium]|nr:transposase [Bacteroidales bacterium]